MKIFKNLFLACLAITLCFYSCSSDDSGNDGGNNELADQQNATEEQAISIANIESGIIIEGATKNDGTPPAPNGDLNFSVDNTTVSGAQNIGLNLKFSSTESDIAGAYLLFNSNGETANQYYDIPSASLNKSSSIKSSKKRSVFKSNKSLTDDEYEIDIDFDDTFPAGKFCAELCIYDSEQNVSQIITVCIEVEAWGGNASIVGDWILESDNTTDIEEIGCNNEQSVSVDYNDEIIKDDVLFKVAANGDYTLDIYSEYKNLDYSATVETCAAVYEDEVEKEESLSTGKWAYNETNKSLTLVEFKYEDFINPEYSEDIPEGELLFDSETENVTVEVVNNKLVLTFSYQDEENEVISFKRK